ncbi:tRNA glutamyl-Q(34) synthetase GluQRS [Suttonella sp. R2A3]|uniref:tRNA glutamyl-Q(34) synthetase GluQRS n=1 Tax=Suttonella sp. R2A3 TaxID=2908648 RepID=UPI001F21F506|nr:tRNA glutamyl-Q(34) synthetase GluQRS [Suttonella sp. R2A3]UJF25247.1 tRNA glutamyl-Q(34) synthetase GluQRS [Suttonella sp. R2A3]
MSISYVGRFAPTPSGPLHFGSLVAAVASYLDARAHHGTWLLRIEDVDRSRSKQQYQDAILRGLATYGLNCDGEIRVQSEHLAHYHDLLHTLKDELYTCTCSRKDWHPHARPGDLGPIYPGFCRKNTVDFEHNDAAIRLYLPNKTIHFTDRWLGELFFDCAHIGDPIVKRRDGDIAYALAVTADDAIQGITHVVRGQDLTAATAIQYHLQNLLNYPHPQYLHHPLVLDHTQRKLSKQNHAQAIDLNDPLPALREALAFLGYRVNHHDSAKDLLSAATDWWLIEIKNRARTI